MTSPLKVHKKNFDDDVYGLGLIVCGRVYCSLSSDQKLEIAQVLRNSLETRRCGVLLT
jgi:hypothetical protein